MDQHCRMRKPFALLPMAGLDLLAGDRSRPSEKRLRLPMFGWFAAAYCHVPGNWAHMVVHIRPGAGGIQCAGQPLVS